MREKPNASVHPSALRSGGVREEDLGFVPVVNTGSTSFSLALDPDTGRLTLHSAGKTFYLELRKEKETNGI